MISIYCDEDVDILIKPLLEAKGFKVLTTLDEKMLGASDIEQMDYTIFSVNPVVNYYCRNNSSCYF